MNAQGTSTSIKQARVEKRNLKRARKAQTEAHLNKRKEEEVKQLEHQQKQVYVPSVSLLFRVLALVRIAGALKAPIQDCDEVYNYWEALHMMQFGSGKQTWEYAPQYALRSYGFLYAYKWMVSLMHVMLGFQSKVQVFYALRIALAMASAGCEAVFVKRIAECVDRKMANMTALALFGLAGMFHAGSAVLPTSFAMCLCMLGSAAAMRAPSDSDRRGHFVRRVAPAVCAFVVGAGGGWPYAIVVAVPFALEEVFVRGESDGSGSWWMWRVRRGCWFAALGIGSLAIVVGAMAAVDSWHYGRPVVAAWNQIAYNVLGKMEGGSQLYGTEPWYFYIKNGLVNGNVVMVLALASLPFWLAYYAVLRITASNKDEANRQSETASRLFAAHWMLLFRILPFFMALCVFSLQPHKEERFLSIVYPHMCFNAAAALSLMHPLCSWAVVRASSLSFSSRSNVPRKLISSASYVDRLSIGVLAVGAFLGVSRMAALGSYYGAPTRAFTLLPHATDAGAAFLPLGPTVKSLWHQYKSSSSSGEEDIQQQADDAAAHQVAEKVVCMGKDWYRFPSSYWLPDNHRLAYISTAHFDGHLPGDFVPTHRSGSLRASTSAQRDDYNAMNRWEPRHALRSDEVDLLCDYVVDIEYPARGKDQEEEAIVADGNKWHVVGCERILDADNTWLLGRVLYVPQQLGRQRWGNMCVYKKE